MKLSTCIFSLSVVVLFGCSNKDAEPTSNEKDLADSMKAAVKGWIGVVNEQKFDDLDKYIADDIIEHESLTDRKGTHTKNVLKEMKEFAETFSKEYHDYKIEIEDMITGGNIIVVRTYETANRERDSSGVKVLTPVQKVGTMWLRWENGKFVEFWSNKESKYFPLM